jgi:hypothetical protein
VSSGFLGNVIGLRWRAEEVGGDGAPPSKGFSRGRGRAVGSEWPELLGSRVKNKPVRIGSVTGSLGQMIVRRRARS